jgi:acetyltransferase-like isoleucine patch superfamily enzyme
MKELIVQILRYVWRIYLRLRWGGRISFGTGARVSPAAVLKPGVGRITIGDKTVIGPGAILDSARGTITIGRRCSVNPYSVLYGHGGLSIGDNVRIATHVVIIPANHIFDRTDVPITDQGGSKLGIVIEDDVWIGANTTILDGAHISRGCVIGAGSVVRGTTEPFGVYAGAPAKLLRSRIQQDSPRIRVSVG